MMFKKSIIWILPAFLLLACGQPGQEEAKAPIAPQHEKQLIMHGDTRIDFYYWMNDPENPEVIAYLEAENNYLKQSLSHVENHREELFNEMLGRLKQDESSAPYFFNGYYYYTRYEEGGEYPIYCRKKSSMDAKEEILLNVPEMAEGYRYFRVGSFSISPDNTMIAYTVDTLGRRQNTIYYKDLATQKVTPTAVELAAGDVEWAADNKTFFFTTIDPVTLRYIRVFRYNIQQKRPIEVYYEKDDTYYYMGVSKTTDGKYLTINASTTLSSETLILEADNPSGNFRVFQPRRRDLIYSVEHLNGKFYILTNYQAQNFRLMETMASRTNINNWKEVIPHRNDVLLENFSVFNDFLVLQERSNALRQMRIINTRNNSEHYLEFEEEAYTAAININLETDTDTFRYSYTSLTTPATIIDYNMNTREQNTIWQQAVLGDFDANAYETRRLFAAARDGARVPVTLVYKKGVRQDGQNPLLQYAYGSYGSSADPRFNSNLISLLDRGFVYAMAHIRGGQEMGRVWYEEGKLLQKINTFNDFIDVSEFLIRENYTSPDMLFAQGGSAGGLLMGAIVNMRPELYKGIIAGVPFVDVVTTMLDETIPLTTSEYDEWGNPNDSLYYHYMLSYSPYDQVQKQSYPNMLITSGLYDSQVQYWEPTKWTAKLRTHNTGDSRIYLYTNMEAGHSGASGRFQRLKETALQYAFMLDLIK
ncbi:MAG: S9 family peptidase [Bacteroidetes bacterium]|nr:MAG: S9 family peptidase [Bacteroidota bacterium]